MIRNGLMDSVQTIGDTGVDSAYIAELNKDLKRFMDMSNPTSAQVDELKNELQRIANRIVSNKYPWP